MEETDVTTDVAVRNTDPETSHIGAASIKMRAGSQRLDLLKAIRSSRTKGLTSAEAAVSASLFRPGVCYWKRVSELAQYGYIESHGTRIDTWTGSPQTVYRITDAGRTAIKDAQ